MQGTRSIRGAHCLHCLQTKEEIANDVKQELSKVMSTFGFEILQALVTDIDPAVRVKDAMNEINAAQRLRWVGGQA